MTPRSIRGYLTSLGSPIVTKGQLAEALGIAPVTLYFRLRIMPAEKQPVMFRAGGVRCMYLEDAITWCEAHFKEHNEDLVRINRGHLIKTDVTGAK